MMSSFLFAALVLLIIASALIFWPLFKAGKLKAKENDQDNITIFKERLHELNVEKEQGYLDATAYQHLKLELEKSLLNDVENLEVTAPIESIRENRHWLMAGFLSFAVLLGSAFLYMKLGRSDDYMRYLVLQEQEQESVDDKKLSDFKTMMARLRAKLTGTPEELPQWYLLAKSYLSMGDYDKAVDTFLEMARFVPEGHPDYAAIKGHYAQALFMAADETMTSDVVKAADAALALDPKESSALTLKGVQAYEQQDYRQAIDYWRQAQFKATPEQVKRFLGPAIASAEDKLGIQPQPTQQAAKTDISIPVRLSLDPALKERVSNDQLIFVFAREVGGRMPLAVVKLKAGALPATIVLDDSKAVMPSGKLSMVTQVNITARVSFSGQAKEQPGDLYAEAGAITVEKRTEPVDLVIANEIK